jgi:hypothetical protein
MARYPADIDLSSFTPVVSTSAGPHRHYASSLGQGGLNVTGLDGVSAQVLSDAIGAIHDCALERPDPKTWRR